MSYTFIGRGGSGGGFREMGPGGVWLPQRWVPRPCGPWMLARAWGGPAAAEDGDDGARRGPCGAGQRRSGMGTTTSGVGCAGWASGVQGWG
jgi:hypothetical protein